MRIDMKAKIPVGCLVQGEPKSFWFLGVLCENMDAPVQEFKHDSRRRRANHDAGDIDGVGNLTDTRVQWYPRLPGKAFRTFTAAGEYPSDNVSVGPQMYSFEIGPTIVGSADEDRTNLHGAVLGSQSWDHPARVID
jgi:hypothetical protein